MLSLPRILANDLKPLDYDTVKRMFQVSQNIPTAEGLPPGMGKKVFTSFFH